MILAQSMPGFVQCNRLDIYVPVDSPGVKIVVKDFSKGDIEFTVIVDIARLPGGRIVKNESKGYSNDTIRKYACGQPAGMCNIRQEKRAADLTEKKLDHSDVKTRNIGRFCDRNF